MLIISSHKSPATARRLQHGRYHQHTTSPATVAAMPMPQSAAEEMTASASDAVIRWTSTGGGWRSMFACFGFGNLFHQAGLLPPSAGGGGAAQSALLSAISTTSGGEVDPLMGNLC